MSNYLWHKLSEEDRKKIEQDSKKLILEFGDSLNKLPAREEAFVERDKDSRVEGPYDDEDPDFRKLMFGNAPEVKDDCIVAEKGKWTEN